MAAALFLAVSAWTGAGLHARLRPPVRTAVVLPGSVTETLELRGLALRRERALLGRGPVTLLPENGQRVAAGQAVAELWDGELLCAPGSALFFSDTDGREDLDPELLEDLDARGLEALMARRSQADWNAFGRLVTGRDWYFAALCREAPPPGDYEILFEGTDRAVPARLLRAEDGLVILRLTWQEGLMSLRIARAQLILRRLQGLQLPADAVRTQPDGTNTVELLTVHGPETRAVTLIYRDESLALCAPEELSPGSTVIIG